jgi:glyoxylase-like metal-dependent hydrolase (beta-lactamase superfamily II)
MATDRRDFIKSSAFLFGAMLYPGKTLSGLTKLFPLSGIREIRSNIGVFTEEGGTIGWYIDEDALVVIDTQFPKTVKNFWNEISEKSQRRIDILFNTHHHGDHTSGNYFLKDFADKIVAQELCPVLQKKFYGTGGDGSEQVYADTTFDKEWEYSIGKEKMNAYHFESAHTEADAFIHFQNANVVHFGDLVFNKIYPYMDRPAGCNIQGLINVLEKAISMFDKDTIFIFGHASSPENVTGKTDALVTMKNYFEALMELVQREVKSGKSLEEIKEIKHIPGFENLIEGWEGAKNMSLTAAYEELSS